MQTLDLASRVRGQVLLPGQDGYDAERTGWNLAVEHCPAMIVVAAAPEDVAATARRSQRKARCSSIPGG